MWELTLCGFVVHLFINLNLSSSEKLIFPVKVAPGLNLCFYERIFFFVYSLAVCARAQRISVTVSVLLRRCPNCKLYGTFAMALLDDLEPDPAEQEIHHTHNGSEQQEVARQRVNWSGHGLSQCNWSFRVSIAQTAATRL